jgi:hypothetical protein
MGPTFGPMLSDVVKHKAGSRLARAVANSLSSYLSNFDAELVPSALEHHRAANMQDLPSPDYKFGVGNQVS